MPEILDKGISSPDWFLKELFICPETKVSA
jgi:hypothetical protein